MQGKINGIIRTYMQFYEERGMNFDEYYCYMYENHHEINKRYYGITENQQMLLLLHIFWFLGFNMP